MHTNEEKNTEHPQKTLQDILYELFQLQSELYVLYEACELRSDRKPGSKHNESASIVAKRLYKKTCKITGDLSIAMQV